MLSANGELLDRATISDLIVWDPVARHFLKLPAGALLHACRIRPFLSIGPQDRRAAYVAEFVWENRSYRCALYGFLPRTRVVGAGDPLNLPAPDALTA